MAVEFVRAVADYFTKLKKSKLLIITNTKDLKKLVTYLSLAYRWNADKRHGYIVRYPSIKNEHISDQSQ